MVALSLQAHYRTLMLAFSSEPVSLSHCVYRAHIVSLTTSLGENIYYGITSIPPFLCCLHTLNSLLFPCERKQRGKKRKSAVQSAPLLCLEKAFMSQNKAPLGDIHSSTNTHTRTHTETQLLLKRLTPKKERGYKFKYQNLLQACQSSPAMIQAGQLNQSGKSWYRAVWRKQRKLLLIRTCVVQ